MKTGCFKWYKENNGVAICRRPPASWSGESYKILAPPLSTFLAIKSKKITQEQYEQEYRSLVLSKLDPFDIIKMFDNKVLLCWEEPIFDSSMNVINTGEGFCHRHIVSSWITESTGTKIEEWRKNEKTSLHIKLF